MDVERTHSTKSSAIGDNNARHGTSWNYISDLRDRLARSQGVTIGFGSQSAVNRSLDFL
jgi:hypothetical protein